MTSHPSSSSHSPSSSSSSASAYQETSRRDEADGGGIAAANPAEDNEADELSPRGCEWEFRLAATVPSPAMVGASDAIGSVDFDPSGSLLATAGIARKVRIYNAATLLLDQQSSSPAACICVPAKLSSVRWRPDSSSSGRFVGCGDYDGVVTEYDLDRGGAATWERDEHSGRRVWALDYSPSSSMAASGSDDRTAHVWDPRSPAAGWATAKASGPVLCVEFDPSGAPRLAVGSADRRAALYDVRNMGRGPVATAEGHARAVTYVRWAPGDRLVTSAADGTHRLWDWAAAGAQGMVGPGREVRAYSGHVSGRSFVGMGLWRGPGLVACGSESNHVFVYDLRWPKPVWVHPFFVPSGDGGGGFVSAVAWRQQAEDGGGGDAGVLVAGGSDGVLKLFTCRRRWRRLRDGEEEDDDPVEDVDGEHQ